MELKKREKIVGLLEEELKYVIGLQHRLECCGEDTPGLDRNIAMLSGALALIKELTDEIKDLEADYDRVYEQAEADIRGNMADGGTSCHWCADKTKADTVKRIQERFDERIREHFVYNGWYLTQTVMPEIAKEVLEGKNDV